MKNLNNGRLVAGAAKSNAYVWNITNSTPCLAGTFVGHTQQITFLAFSSPSSLITISLDKSVKIWKIDAPLTDPVITDPKSTSIASALIQSVTLQSKDGITITSDSDGIVKIWDIFTGLCKASHQTPAKGTDCRDVQLINGRLVCVWYSNEKVHMWDTEKGELWGVDYESPTGVEDLRISGDGSKIFQQNVGFIQAYSAQTGELVGRVRAKRILVKEPLIVDGSRVWIYNSKLGYEGWDFGITGSPVQLYNIPPHKLHPSGAMLWDISLSRIKDCSAERVVFQLSGGFAKPVDAQWNRQYLVVCYPFNKVLILDFSHLLQ